MEIERTVHVYDRWLVVEMFVGAYVRVYITGGWSIYMCSVCTHAKCSYWNMRLVHAFE